MTPNDSRREPAVSSYAQRELRIAAAGTQRPWGAGVTTWAVNVAAIELMLAHRPHAFMLSFGDPRLFAAAR